MKLKYRNYGLWTALGALVVMLLNDSLQIAPAITEPYIDLVLTILIGAGVISNPKEGKGFIDNKE